MSFSRLVACSGSRVRILHSAFPDVSHESIFAFVVVAYRSDDIIVQALASVIVEAPDALVYVIDNDVWPGIHAFAE